MVITFHSPDPMPLLLLVQPHQQVQKNRLIIITFHSPDPMQLLLLVQPYQQVQENRLMVITFHSPDPMKLLLLEQPHQQVQGDRLMGLHCLQSKNPENGIQFFILIYILVFYNKK